MPSSSDNSTPSFFWELPSPLTSNHGLQFTPSSVVEPWPKPTRALHSRGHVTGSEMGLRPNTGDTLKYWLGCWASAGPLSRQPSVWENDKLAQPATTQTLSENGTHTKEELPKAAKKETKFWCHLIPGAQPHLSATINLDFSFNQPINSLLA